MPFVMGIVPVGFKQAQLALAGIQNGYPKAVTEAINRSLLAGRTAAAKNVSARYAIKSSVLKESGLEVNKATWKHLEGDLSVRSGMLNVGQFTPQVRMEKGKQHVSVTIIRGEKRLVKGAFRLPDGRVMERRQPTRLPIYPVMTIGVSQMAGEHGVSTAIQQAMNQTLATRLKHNVDFALGKLEDQSKSVRLKARQKLREKEVGTSQ